MRLNRQILSNKIHPSFPRTRESSEYNALFVDLSLDPRVRGDDEVARRDDEVARRDDEVARRDDEVGKNFFRNPGKITVFLAVAMADN